MSNDVAHSNNTTLADCHAPGEGWTRLPGLFERWELEGEIEPGEDYYFARVETQKASRPLFAIYHRDCGVEACAQ